MSLTTEYPLWLIVVCALVAAGGSWFLYRNNKLDLSGRYGKLALRALMAFRFLLLFIIAFLLLGPLMKMISRKVEKPFIVVAIDNSESITSHKDSAFYRREFPGVIEKIQQALHGDYEVKTYTFGKEFKAATSPSFTEKQTDIAAAFNEIENAYSNQNLGAVILASDGIYNEGNNPLYNARELKAPVFTIALGDTAQHKDLLIKGVQHNQLVYQGNMFPLQVDIGAFGCQDQHTVLTVQHNGQNVFSKEVQAGANRFFTSVPLQLEAKEAGMQHYVVNITKLGGEVTYVNNRADVFINVISGKQKILLVALAPHPDLAAYRKAIESNENYTVLLKYANDPPDAAALRDCNLAILHQLPGPRGEGNNTITQLKGKRIPLLYVLGAQTSLPVFNSIQNSLSVSGNQGNVNEALPLPDPAFSLFSIQEEELNAIRKFPPLQSPYGGYRIAGESSILFRQQIGYVKTDFPLVFFSRTENGKAGYICGEGFWRWSLQDVALSNQQATHGLMSSIVQYLAAKDDKSLFRMSNTKKRFDENEPVQFDVEVYNESYQLVNQPEVTMQIRNAEGKTFSYTFSRTEKAYTLDAGIMPVGNYRYEASVNLGSKIERLKGVFTVMPLQMEFLQTVADHQLLNQLSSQSGGKLFYPNQGEELIKAIKEDEAIKPVIYSQEEVKSLINLKWLFFLLLTCMSLEWGIRKWNGSV